MQIEYRFNIEYKNGESDACVSILRLETDEQLGIYRYKNKRPLTEIELQGYKKYDYDGSWHKHETIVLHCADMEEVDLNLEFIKNKLLNLERN